ncbi:MAG: hypothetical protein ACREAF_00695 [Nitrosopumilaceae archaeon]
MTQEHNTHSGDRINAQCSKCFHNWFPFLGKGGISLPYTCIVICPKCGHNETMTWADDETRKKYTQKMLGLLDDKTTNKRIIELEKKITILQQEFELEKKRRELAEVDTQWIKEWAKRREKDFEDIDLLLEEERERQRFRDDIGT